MDLNKVISDHLARGERGALATITEKVGAAPGDEGARMFVTSEGRVYGTIGGGLLEAGVWRAAIDAIATGRHRMLRFRMDGKGVGDEDMVCGGSVSLFIEPIDARQGELYDAIRNVIKRDAKGLIVTRYTDSTLSKSLLHSDGTVAGDPLDHTVVARLSVHAERPVLEDGLIAVPILTRSRLYIFGAGHVSQYISRIADMTHFDVTVIDDRADYCNEVRFPEAKEVIVEAFDTVFEHLPFYGSDYVVIVTRGHKHDALVLGHVLKRPTRYLGMIGSTRKTKMIFSHLNAKGFDERLLTQVYAPIRLDIGSETPQEIAVSIVAELIKVRREPEARREPSAARPDGPEGRSHHSPDHHKILFG
jgi:xanthine dehydrogenase accessory factor